jgi:hypothetical protein
MVYGKVESKQSNSTAQEYIQKPQLGSDQTCIQQKWCKTFVRAVLDLGALSKAVISRHLRKTLPYSTQPGLELETLIKRLDFLASRTTTIPSNQERPGVGLASSQW